MTNTDEIQRCKRCGQAIPREERDCPSCGAQRPSFYRRDTVLLLSLLGLALLFIFTGFTTRRYHATERALAQRLYNKGQAELLRSRSDLAIEDFRSAIAYAPSGDLYRLALARALVANRRSEEAQAYLVSLWNDEPADGDVNLELGRIAAKNGDLPQTLRYYHNAVYGIWRHDPETQARAARLELCQALLDHGDQHDAEAELIALSGNLTGDPALLTRVGDLFARAGDNDRALRQYSRALALDHGFQAALVGAGVASFDLARYEDARSYLERAVRMGAHGSDLVRDLDVATEVVEIDPYEHRLSARERSRRVVRAFDQATERLEACMAGHSGANGTGPRQTSLEQASSDASVLKPEVSESKLARDPDLITQASDVVVEAEQASSALCGPPQGLDQAIVLAIARHASAR